MWRATCNFLRHYKLSIGYLIVVIGVIVALYLDFELSQDIQKTQDHIAHSVAVLCQKQEDTSVRLDSALVALDELGNVLALLPLDQSSETTERAQKFYDEIREAFNAIEAIPSEAADYSCNIEDVILGRSN